jgi:hypothetical protein
LARYQPGFAPCGKMRPMVLLQNIFSISEIGIEVFVSNFRSLGIGLNRSVDRLKTSTVKAGNCGEADRADWHKLHITLAAIWFTI